MAEKTEKKDETKTDVITEDALQKTLAKLENKEDKPEDKKQDPIVKTPEIDKTLTDKVKNDAPETLKKAMDVSKVLKEFVEITALHVDATLEMLQKSIQAGAERDNSVIKILEKNAERIEKLEERVEKFGNTPANDPKTVTADKVLTKDGGEAKPEKKFGRQETLAQLMKMAMDAKPESQEARRWSLAVTRYETSGTIKDEDLPEVHRQLVAA